MFSFSRPLTGRSWMATLPFRPDSILLNPPLSRLLILLLLLASGNVYPNTGPTLFAQQTPNILAPTAPVSLGKSLSSVAAVRIGSTPPAPGSLDPL